jgi:hypothetical protein
VAPASAAQTVVVASAAAGNYTGGETMRRIFLVLAICGTASVALVVPAVAKTPKPTKYHVVFHYEGAMGPTTEESALLLYKNLTFEITEFFEGKCAGTYTKTGKEITLTGEYQPDVFCELEGSKGKKKVKYQGAFRFYAPDTGFDGTWEATRVK